MLHAELGLEQAVHRARGSLPCRSAVRPLKSAPGSQMSSSTTGRAALQQQQPAHLHHGRRQRFSSSARATSRRRAQAAAVEQPALQRRAARRSSGIRRRKRYWRALLGVRGHEGALALAAHQQVLGGQLVDGLAHRALADAEARGQFRSRSGWPRRAATRPPAGPAPAAP
jgi:hypothetical protein